jgi:hypothetical protein
MGALRNAVAGTPGGKAMGFNAGGVGSGAPGDDGASPPTIFEVHSPVLI